MVRVSLNSYFRDNIKYNKKNEIEKDPLHSKGSNAFLKV
jgi:hypothetical protein